MERRVGVRPVREIGEIEADAAARGLRLFVEAWLFLVELGPDLFAPRAGGVLLEILLRALQPRAFGGGDAIGAVVFEIVRSGGDGTHLSAARKGDETRPERETTKVHGAPSVVPASTANPGSGPGG